MLSQDSLRLRLATTTSTEDSGLLAAILPDFERTYHARVDVVAVGTGQALAIGSRGDADVVRVHARSKEEAFVAAGDGVNRQEVMYNDFVIVGPAADPAGVRGLTLLLGGEDISQNHDRTLLNPYGVIQVNPARYSDVNAALAGQFVAWLTSLPVQQMIADFGRERYGQALFYPNSAQWLAAHP